MNKSTSCGIMLVDDYSILLGHATMNKKQHGYDIFKGKKEEGESPSDAALRELTEETGITKIRKSDLIEAGLYKYRPNKDLHLFIYKSDNLEEEFDTEKLFCFTMVPGKNYPEMNSYLIVPFDKMDFYMYRSLFPVVYKALVEKGLI